jgi:hypothetical protein
MTKIDTVVVLLSYLAASLIIFGVAWWIQGRYSHTLLLVPILVFGALTAVWLQIKEKS